MLSSSPLPTIAALSLLVASAAAPGPVRGQDVAQPPNVVFLLADDLGWMDLGCYGSTFYETPNIDRLAASGVRFTDAYASCPVCSPSRAAIMTGKNPARLGLTAHIGDAGPKHWKRDTPLLPAPYVDRLVHRERTIAEALHETGYATMHAGKWHLGHEPFWPEYHGFDVNVGGWSQGGPFTGKQYFSPYDNPRLADGPDGEHLPERLAEEAARFITAHRHEPFFLHLAWYSVHVPLQAPDGLVAEYEQKRKDAGWDADEMRDTRDGVARVRQDHAIYAAMVESLDRAVGRVLEALENAEVTDNTLIVFTSDNGGLATGDVGISKNQGWPTSNEPLRAGKGWLYEGGIRVPLIVSGPDVRRGASVSRVVTGSDYYATLLELTNRAPDEPQAADSASFADVLRGDAESARGPVFWHYPHYGNQGGRPGGVVRDGDWKLIEWYGADANDTVVELYNLADDVSEESDLSQAEPTRRDAMLAMLREWRHEHRVRMPTPRRPMVAEQVDVPRAALAPTSPAAQ